MQNKNNIEKNCCHREAANNSKTNKKGFFRGIIYGLLPHSFCILFIVFSAFGATVGAVFFKKFLLIPYLFPFLICLSFVFATLSAVIYLKRDGSLSIKNIQRRWKYLSILYGTTLLINLLFFYVVFPVVANLDFSNRHIVVDNNFSSLILEVDIPCSGHAPLITDEIKKVSGVKDVNFKLPNLFEITYNSTKASQEKILSLDIFKIYKAVIK